MSADALKSLLTNSTITCKNLQKDHESSVYFRDDGTARRLNLQGEKIPGNWRVTEYGKHCVDWGKKNVAIMLSTKATVVIRNWRMTSPELNLQ